MASIADPAPMNDLSREPGESPRFVFLGMPDMHGSLRGKAMTGTEFEALVRRGTAPVTDLLLALDPVDEPIADYTRGLRRRVGPFRFTRRYEMDRLADVRSVREPGAADRHRIEFLCGGRARRFGRRLSAQEASCIVHLIRGSEGFLRPPA